MQQTSGFFHNKQVVLLAIFTLITVFAWVGFEAYSTATKKDIPSQTQQMLTPISPNVRMDVLQTLQNKEP